MLFFPSPRNVLARQEYDPRSGPRCRDAVVLWKMAIRFERSQLLYCSPTAQSGARPLVHECHNPPRDQFPGQLLLEKTMPFSTMPSPPGQVRRAASVAFSKFRDTTLGTLQRSERTSQRRESGSLRNRKRLNAQRQTASFSTAAGKLPHLFAERDLPPPSG